METAVKVVATQKSLGKQKEALHVYLTRIIARKDLLKKCPEVLKFLGADEACLPEIQMQDRLVQTKADSFGRRDTKVSRINADNFPEIGATSKLTTIIVVNKHALRDQPKVIENENKTKGPAKQNSGLGGSSNRNEQIPKKEKRMSIGVQKIFKQGEALVQRKTLCKWHILRLWKHD